MTRKEVINSFAIDKLLGLGPAFSENEIQYNNGYMRGLIEGAEWADRTMLYKACEWLSKHAKKYYFNKDGHYLGTDELVEDFKLSMEL